MEVGANENVRYIMACTCAFSKYVELFAIPNKRAETTTKYFRDGIMYRYGQPLVVRTNGGGEFQGEFNKILVETNLNMEKKAKR